MKNAKSRDTAEIHGLRQRLISMARRGHLVNYLKKEKRWAVQFYAGVVG